MKKAKASRGVTHCSLDSSFILHPSSFILLGVPPMTADQKTRDATSDALLTAGASAVCLVLAESFGLEHANLAVWTTYLVTAQYPFTRFQKGLERVVGRGLGILAGLVLTTWFHDTPLADRGPDGRPADDLLLRLLLRAAGLPVSASRSVRRRRVPDRPRQPRFGRPGGGGVVRRRCTRRGGRRRGDLAVRRRARPRHPVRGGPPLAAARRLAEPEPDAGGHGAADSARGPRARPPAREGGHLGHAPDGDPARAGAGSEGGAAPRRFVPGRGLGRGHVPGGGPGAPPAGPRRPAVPRPVRGGLPDPDG